MATIEELADEVAALRRRVDASEAVLQLQALKARYGELVDGRYSSGAVVDGAELERIADEICRAVHRRRGVGRRAGARHGHRSSGHRGATTGSDPVVLTPSVREAEYPGGRRPGVGPVGPPVPVPEP